MKKRFHFIAAIVIIVLFSSSVSRVAATEGQGDKKCGTDQNFLRGFCVEDTEGQPACVLQDQNQNCSSSLGWTNIINVSLLEKQADNFK